MVSIFARMTGKNKCLCGVSQQVLPEVEAFRRIPNILDVCGRTQVAVTGRQKEYTVQRDTEGGDKCKMCFSRQSQEYLFMAYSIKLNGSPGGGGEEGRSHTWIIRECLSASRLFDSEKGYKSTLHLLED